MGVAQVDNQLKATQAAPEAKMYTVQKGDNLWKIAEAQYGKGQGAKNTLIFEANKPMLTSPDKIYPGQVLRIRQRPECPRSIRIAGRRARRRLIAALIPRLPR